MILSCRLASFGHQGFFGHRPKKCVFECFRGQTEAGTLLFKFAFLGKFLEYDRIVREILL